MKRNKGLEFSSKNNIAAYKRRVAFHEAGHAVAIHVNNNIKKLPPVFFQITFNDIHSKSKTPSDPHLLQCSSTIDDYSAKVEGGRLINNLPDSLDRFIKQLDNDNQKQVSASFLTSFEADIVNLLIGPLAEAKHVAIYDDEVFYKYLFVADSLHNYGGTSDLALINDYLTCFSSCKNAQNQKLTEFLVQAFDFVDNDSNWEKIVKLTHHIIDNDIKTIDYNEISTVLNADQSTCNNSMFLLKQ